MVDNKRTEWFLGIDLGTGSCKSVVIDAQARLLGFGAGNYSIRENTSQWEEQDPRKLITALIQSVRSAIRDAGINPYACQAFSIGGAYHSLIAIDKNDQPLTGVITWVDGRATKQAQAIIDSNNAQEIYSQTGCPVHGMFPLYKIIWLREEQPQLFQESARFISAKEYVTKQLLGEYLVDSGIAAGSSLLNTNTLKWNERSLDLAGIRSRQLSQLMNPRQTVKRVER